MSSLSTFINSKEESLQGVVGNKLFGDPAAAIFFKETANKLLSHTKVRVQHLDTLLSALGQELKINLSAHVGPIIYGPKNYKLPTDVNVKLKTSDIIKEMTSELSEQRHEIQKADDEINENNKQKSEAKDDLADARQRLIRQRGRIFQHLILKT